MRTWKLEDAKNQFSEVVRRALNHEPQLVTRRGQDAVVVISKADFERLAAPENLFDFLQRSPLADAVAAEEFDLDRPVDYGREINF